MRRYAYSECRRSAINSLGILVISSFIAALVLTPLCRNLAIRWGLLDHPDKIRKFHKKAIPRVGGIPIFIAYLASLGMLVLFRLHESHTSRSHFDVVLSLLPAAMIVLFTGLLDDFLKFKPWQKLLPQIAAAFIAVTSGVHISTIANRQLPSWFAIPFTLIWLVGCTNAFNLIDGMDGLATGVGLFVTAITCIAALLGHNTGLAIATVPLLGALLGFLLFNFNPASIFLGDSGSLFIGFLLGCYSVFWIQKSATFLSMAAPLIALSIPLLDTGLAIVRRFLRYRSILSADHGHIHHKLLARGFSPRKAVLFMYLICAICGGLALLQSFAYRQVGGFVIVILCIGVCIGIHQLRYAEFEAARNLIVGGSFRRRLNAELQLNNFCEALAGAATLEECWEVLRKAYSEFGFIGIRMQVGGRLYTHTIGGSRLANTWTVRIRLSENGYLNLSREFNQKEPPALGRFTDAIGKMLNVKIRHIVAPAPVFRHRPMSVPMEHVSEAIEITAS
jgi:UDP-GlcNAc:undecaprenyl-phosphate GlcNAc-1-phosphate transferase